MKGGEEEEKVAEGQQKQKTKRGFCGRKSLPKESDDEKKALLTPAAKAKAKLKAAPKRSSSRKKKSKQPRTLGFEQWRRWLLESELLPPALVAGNVPDAPGDGGDGGAGVGLMEPAVEGNAQVGVFKVQSTARAGDDTDSNNSDGAGWQAQARQTS